MSDSNELFGQATKAVQDITSCSEIAAQHVVLSIAAYISRFQAELSKRSGPAWDSAKGMRKEKREK